MLSENPRYQKQRVFDMKESVARERAKQLLNKKMPQHPPDIYFIRRNDKLLDKYLDPEEMKELVKNVDNSHKLNYNLFRLNQEERDEMKATRTRRRNFYNPGDPYYKNKTYNKTNDKVLQTGRLLGIIKPHDHREYVSDSIENIQANSKNLTDKYCDKESAFYSRSGDGNNAGGFKGMSHHKIVRLQGKQIRDAAQQNSYVVPYDGKEYEYQKLDRIQRDLKGSMDLKINERVEDTDEFENFTNREFNRKNGVELLAQSYDTGLAGVTTPASQVVLDDYNQQTQSTDQAMNKMFGTVQIDETKVQQFTFANRYKKGGVHQRNTSNLLASQKRLQSQGQNLMGIEQRGKSVSISSQRQIISQN